MKIKLAALAALSLLLAACVSTQSITPRTEIVNHPELGVLAQAELGDTIVEKGKVTTFDGLLLQNELTWGDGFLLKKFTIPPGRLRAKQKDAKFTYFYSDKMTVYDAMLGTAPYGAGGICVKNSDPAYVRGFFLTGKCANNFKPSPVVTPIRVVDVDAPNFRQELIYNGRSGDTVKFLYREFSGDYARPPFSQDIQYDLRDGNMIGFKGVRIEVVEATNTKLSYRLNSSFPDMP